MLAAASSLVASLRMQAPSKRDAAALFAKVVEEQIPDESAVAAWTAFLRAHASLMRRLDADLRRQTGAGLNEFDVLATLAMAGGALRMTDLAERAYSSRSGMTRRVDHLVSMGFLSRTSDGADGRSVVVAMTDKGVSRLSELAPAHMRGIQELFVARLRPGELDTLRRALKKVTPAASFG